MLLDLSGEAPPPQAHVGDLAPPPRRATGSASCSRAARIVYDVDANWKAIAENYSECLHCPGVHPELNRLSHYLSGETIEGAGAWCGGSMTLRRGRRDDGAPTARARPPADRRRRGRPRSILYFLLFPNTLVSLHPDYVMLHTLWPRAPDRTEVVCEWFFEPDDDRRATASTPPTRSSFWDQVNREDWHVCALTQRGMELARVHARPLHDAGGRRARRST